MRSQRASSRCHTANGYPLREGPEAKPLSPIYGPLIDDTTLPVRISDTVVLDQRIKIQNSALAYKTGVEGLAIANGFVYRGKRWPQLQGAVVFGDITSGRLFYARMADLVAATDGNPATVAPYAEITTALPALVQERVNANASPRGPATGRTGGPPAAAAPGTTTAAPAPAPAAGPAAGPTGGRGAAPAGAAAPRPMRLELRIATDEAGEIYILTKSDGVVRRVMNIR